MSTTDNATDLAGLNAWFRGLTPEEKRTHGAEFNRRRAELAAPKPAAQAIGGPRPEPPRGRWVRFAAEPNLDSHMAKAGFYIAKYHDVWVAD